MEDLLGFKAVADKLSTDGVKVDIQLPSATLTKLFLVGLGLIAVAAFARVIISGMIKN